MNRFGVIPVVLLAAMLSFSAHAGHPAPLNLQPKSSTLPIGDHELPPAHALKRGFMIRAINVCTGDLLDRFTVRDDETHYLSTRINGQSVALRLFSDADRAGQIGLQLLADNDRTGLPQAVSESYIGYNSVLTWERLGFELQVIQLPPHPESSPLRFE